MIVRNTLSFAQSLLLLAGWLSGTAYGQNPESSSFMGVGNRPLTSSNLSPGQIFTVSVRLSKPILEYVQRSSGTTDEGLAGLKLTLGDNLSAPILSIRRDYNCWSPLDSACRTLNVVTAQFPTTFFREPICGELALWVDGKKADLFRICTTPAQTKVVGPGCSDLSSVDCLGTVFHADGSEVSYRKPARPGEKLVLYAIGMGYQAGPDGSIVAAGQPAPPGSTLVVQGFRFVLGFLPYIVFTTPPEGVPVNFRVITPDFVGVVAGQIGLYQVNFTLPDALPLLQGRCSLEQERNVTLTLGGGGSLETVSFCAAEN